MSFRYDIEKLLLNIFFEKTTGISCTHGTAVYYISKNLLSHIFKVQCNKNIAENYGLIVFQCAISFSLFKLDPEFFITIKGSVEKDFYFMISFSGLFQLYFSMCPYSLTLYIWPFFHSIHSNVYEMIFLIKWIVSIASGFKPKQQ